MKRGLVHNSKPNYTGPTYRSYFLSYSHSPFKHNHLCQLIERKMYTTNHSWFTVLLWSLKIDFQTVSFICIHITDYSKHEVICSRSKFLHVLIDFNSRKSSSQSIYRPICCTRAPRFHIIYFESFVNSRIVCLHSNNIDRGWFYFFS